MLVMDALGRVVVVVVVVGAAAADGRGEMLFAAASSNLGGWLFSVQVTDVVLVAAVAAFAAFGSTAAVVLSLGFFAADGLVSPLSSVRSFWFVETRFSHLLESK